MPSTAWRGVGRDAPASAARVAGPAEPSRERPLAFWKAMTACWVVRP
jgi:hypothetical protein